MAGDRWFVERTIRDRDCGPFAAARDRQLVYFHGVAEDANAEKAHARARASAYTALRDAVSLKLNESSAEASVMPRIHGLLTAGEKTCRTTFRYRHARTGATADQQVFEAHVLLSVAASQLNYAIRNEIRAGDGFDGGALYPAGCQDRHAPKPTVEDVEP